MLDSHVLNRELNINDFVDTPRVICNINRFCACITHQDIFDGTSVDDYLSFFSLITNDQQRNDASLVFPLRFATIFILNFIKSKISPNPIFDDLGIHSINF